MSQKTLQMFVVAAFLYNSQNFETIQMSFNGQMIKQTVVYPYHGILVSSKKQYIADTCNHLDKSPENFAEKI